MLHPYIRNMATLFWQDFCIFAALILYKGIKTHYGKFFDETIWH